MEGSVISDVLEKKEMKGNKENVLDLSGKQLQSMNNLPKHSSISELILDNNSIKKIEKLDAFPKLCLLSMRGNHLMRMNGVNFGKSLMSVNLSNNGIVSMEGLCWLVHLEYLDLSKNNIQRIQNVSYCTKLKHMDLTENSIASLSNLQSLVELQVLLLHGNTITTLERAKENLPEHIETLTLSGNGISDLNEVRHLSFLMNLKHFSIMDNPCVMTTSSLPGFNYRPYILSCLPSLVTLDGVIVTDNERRDAERLSRDENLSLFTFGHHLQLVLYLSKTSPIHHTTQLSDDHNNIMEDFLQRRRMEIFGEEKSMEVKRKVPGINNHDEKSSEVCDVKATDTLESSSYSVLEFSESTRNENGSFSPDDDSETDTLRSESRFLPVYSPQKKSPRKDQRRFQTSWEASHPNNDEDVPNMTDDFTNESEDFPVMTEEEANKLINLAATILQSHIRGFLARRKFDYRKFKKSHTAASKIQALWRGYFFRSYSNEFWHFKNELRVRRLQKYISMLCFMRHKSDKRHEVEKQRMLEIITLLYEKFSHLSEKVEKLESSRNIGDKIERNDELRNDSEAALDPVFFPHPRLTRNTEGTENDVNGAAVDLSQDTQSTNNTKFEKTFEDCGEDFGTNQEDTVQNRDALIEQEDHLWDNKLHKVEDDGIEDDKIMDNECHWNIEEESETSTETEDEGSIEKGTDNDSYGHEIYKLPHGKLSTDIPDLTENVIMTSEAFTTANVSELLKTIESDKKDEMIKILASTKKDQVDSEPKQDFRSDEVTTEDFSVGVTFQYKQPQVHMESQFENTKPPTSNVENYHELEANVELEADDITRHEMQSVETCEVLENDNIQHVLNCSSDEDDVGVPPNTENKMADRFGEHEDDSFIIKHEDPNKNQEIKTSFDPFVGEDGKTLTGDNIEQDFAPDAWSIDESTQRTGQEECSVVASTGIKPCEKTELSSQDQEVIENVEITTHENTAGDAIKDSLEQIKFSQDQSIISTIESKNCVLANADDDLANIDNNRSESFDKLQENDTESSQDVVVNASIANNKESGFDSNLAETENNEVKDEETSPRLRERASSLLSALKDEITGVSSKDNQQENISLTASQLSGCHPDDTKDVESDLSNEFPHESQKK